MPIYESEFPGAVIDARLAAVATMQTAISNLEAAVAAKYSKPANGIPETDLAANVQSALALARTAVQSLSDYYTKAQVDDITAAIAASVNSTIGEVVTTLPSAGAGTLGKIYYVGPDGSGFYDRYVTSYDGSTYSWLALGDTEVDMTQYATVEQFNQLDQEVNGLDIDEPWSALSPNPTTLTIPLSVPVGETIKVKVYNTGTNNSTIYVDSRDSSDARIAYIISSTSVSSGSSTSEVPYTVPAGMKAIRVAVASGRSTFRVTIKGAAGIAAEIRGLDTKGDKLYQSLLVTGAYVNYAGQLIANQYCNAVDKMPILPGKGFTVTNVRFGNATAIASYVFFDAAKNVIAAGWYPDTTVPTAVFSPSDIPDDARYVSFTIDGSSQFDGVVSIYDIVKEIDQNATPKNLVFNSLSGQGDVASNTYLLLGKVHIMKNTLLSARITGEITSVNIGVGYNEEISTAHPTNRGFNARWFNITPSKLNLYGHSSGDDYLVASYDHGLTLGTETEIAVRTIFNGSIFVYTVRLHDGNGNYFEQSISNWGMGRPFAQNLGASSLHISMRFMPEDIYRPIWLFGDSYVSFGTEERWPYYVVNQGFYHFLMNARPGESAEEGWADLQTLINAGGLPKMLCWTLGMNGDGTETQVDGQYVINTFQKTYIDNVKALCEAVGIVPVFATIPTVPSLQKTGLSNYVRSLGCRYIDFAEAVGATSAGVWKDGMLSSDNIHPTAIGAKALAMRVLVDFPEIGEGV